MAFSSSTQRQSSDAGWPQVQESLAARSLLLPLLPLLLLC
jgi:hypothetical protein